MLGVSHHAPVCKHTLTGVPAHPRASTQSGGCQHTRVITCVTAVCGHAPACQHTQTGRWHPAVFSRTAHALTHICAITRFGVCWHLLGVCWHALACQYTQTSVMAPAIVLAHVTRVLAHRRANMASGTSWARVGTPARANTRLRAPTHAACHHAIRCVSARGVCQHSVRRVLTRDPMSLGAY